MSRYSGVVLDFYDDQGATLKSKFPTADVLPEQIKTASVTPKDELPDEAFALIAVDEGGEVLKKYACDNPGTTAMSVVYFMEHGDKLPQAAMEKVADRLTNACVEHGILPPAALAKHAFTLLEAGMAAAALPVLAYGGHAAYKATKKALKKTKTKEAGLGTEILKAELRAMKAPVMIGAASGAVGGAMGAGPVATKEFGQGMSSEKAKELAKGSIRGAALGAITGAAFGPMMGSRLGTGVLGLGLGAAYGRQGAEEGREKRSKTAEVIDITGQRPMTRVVKTAHTMYRGKFPIDSWSQVKQAEQYLQDEGCRMDRGVYRECSVKLAERAEEIGYPLDGQIKEAGATTYAGMEHRLAAMGMRKQLGADGDFLDELFVKTAGMDPEVCAETLRRFDVNNGLDRFWGNRIPDPWESTFGLQKTAEVIWESGGERLTDHALRNLVENGMPLLVKQFTDDLAEGLRKEPVAVFNSMPEPEKRILARMADDLMHDGESMGSHPWGQDNPSTTKVGMSKEAKLRVGDIEDELGIWLPDEKEQRVRKMIQNQEQRRFALRHPWLTGIPTLGIAPAISKANAIESITNRLMRSDPVIRSQTSEAREERRQRWLENQRLDIERARAEQAERVAGQAANALIGAAMAYGATRRED